MNCDVAALRAEVKANQNPAAARLRMHNGDARALLRNACQQVDTVLSKLWQAWIFPPRWLAAVGGYGRGELYPASDIDLLILLTRRQCCVAGKAGAPGRPFLGHRPRNRAQRANDPGVPG
jgi:UTP:GlnB (protein PII) uridylyltransferase